MIIELNKDQADKLGCKEGQKIEIKEESTQIDEQVDIKKIIKDLVDSDLSSTNEQQGKFSQLIRGLAFSKDPLSNKFMKGLDSLITKYGTNFLKEN